MKRIRGALVAIVVGTVLVSTAAGLLVGELWAIVTGIAGVLTAVTFTSYVQTKALQTAKQRMTGLQRMQERQFAQLTQLLAQSGHTGAAVLPPEARRAFEDLTLAARSLTVPQAHFDQLLRTISANTVRTEQAIDDAIAELRSTSVDSSPTDTIQQSRP